MSSDRDWIAELRAQHDLLLNKRELRYTTYRRQSRGRNERIPSRISWEPAEDDSKTLQELKQTNREINALYTEFDTQSSDDTDTYQERLENLLAAFQYDISSRLLAETIGCSVGYARRFRWDEESETVRESDWSRKQREEQAPPALVKRVRNRDSNICVRCERSANLSVHHIIPVSQGGKARMKNLVTLCERCHRDAHGGALCKGDVVYTTLGDFWTWINR